GIRDRNVTGVQTCALPISRNEFSVSFASSAVTSSVGSKAAVQKDEYTLIARSVASLVRPPIIRSFVRSSSRAFPGRILSGQCAKIGRASCREREAISQGGV